MTAAARVVSSLSSTIFSDFSQGNFMRDLSDSGTYLNFPQGNFMGDLSDSGTYLTSPRGTSGTYLKIVMEMLVDYAESAAKVSYCFSHTCHTIANSLAKVLPEIALTHSKIGCSQSLRTASWEYSEMNFVMVEISKSL
jgi:hypothetical protein